MFRLDTGTVFCHCIDTILPDSCRRNTQRAHYSPHCLVSGTVEHGTVPVLSRTTGFDSISLGLREETDKAPDSHISQQRIGGDGESSPFCFLPDDGHSSSPERERKPRTVRHRH